MLNVQIYCCYFNKSETILCTLFACFGMEHPTRSMHNSPAACAL